MDIPLATPPRMRKSRSTAVAGDAASLDRPRIDETLIDMLLWHGWRFERPNPWSPDVFLRPPPDHPRAGDSLSGSHAIEALWRKRMVRVPPWVIEN